MLDKIDKSILEKVSSLHEVPMGAYNIRKNGASIDRKTTKNIDIKSLMTGEGIEIIIKPNTKNESVHIPVVLSKAGLKDVVKNDFYIGENCEVLIVAGCGIHNDSNVESRHDGVHRFFVGKNAKVKYIEKHYGEGKGNSRGISPVTELFLEEGSSFQMESAQIGGVTDAVRRTRAVLHKNATLVINEKVLTEKNDTVQSFFELDLEGENSSADIISRAVAKDSSVQKFNSKLNGRSKCFGHTECDAIIVGNAHVYASPEVNAFNSDAKLIHEAAIGKIAGEQITKLLTLGLTQEEAERVIINGFLN